MIRFLWAQFLLFAALAFALPRDLGEGAQFSLPYRLITYLTYIPVGAMILYTALGGSRTPRAKASVPRIMSVLVLLMTVMVGYMVLVGFVGNPNPKVMGPLFLIEGLPLLAVVLVVHGRSIVEGERAFGDLLAGQAMLGGLASLWLLARYPVIESRYEVNLAHEMAFALLSTSTLAVLVLPSLGKWQRVAALFGYGCTVALSLAYQGRLQTLLYMAVVPLGWLFVQWRAGVLASSIRRSLAPTVIVGLLAVTFVLTIPAARLQVERGIDQTLTRFSRTRALVDSRSSNEAPEARWIEASEFVNASTWKTWLVGEGIGGSWRSEYMGSGMKDSMWPMVHFGPLHLVLKGGMPLLIVFHALYVLIVIRLWRRSARSRLAGAVLVFAIIVYAGFLSHGPVGHKYSTYFTWAVLGVACASLPSRNRPVSRAPSA